MTISRHFPLTKLLTNFLLVPLFIALPCEAATEIAFGPVRGNPGESIRLVSTATCEGGTVEIERDGRVVRESLKVLSERDMAWTFRDPAADGTIRGMVSIARMSRQSTATINGKEQKSEDLSPLNGKMFAMTKAPGADWKFELDGSVPMNRVQTEIHELTTYLKRTWYPQRVVKVGDSWEFDPAWTRMIIERDLQHAQTIGTMKLRQVRHTPGKSVAVIDVSVRSTGGDFRADGSESRAQIELNGQVLVDLKTMLDETLELKGMIVTSSGRPGDRKKVTLPVNLVVNKSFVR